MKSGLSLYINIHVHTLVYIVPSSLLPYTNIPNIMIFKRMRNDQCFNMPPSSIKLSAVPPGSPSRTRAKMPMVNPSLLTACLWVQEAKFSAARTVPI